MTPRRSLRILVATAASAIILLVGVFAALPDMAVAGDPAVRNPSADEQTQPQSCWVWTHHTRVVTSRFYSDTVLPNGGRIRHFYEVGHYVLHDVTECGDEQVWTYRGTRPFHELVASLVIPPPDPDPCEITPGCV